MNSSAMELMRLTSRTSSIVACGFENLMFSTIASVVEEEIVLEHYLEVGAVFAQLDAGQAARACRS